MYALSSLIFLSGTVMFTTGTGILQKHRNRWQANCIQFIQIVANYIFRLLSKYMRQQMIGISMLVLQTTFKSQQKGEAPKETIKGWTWVYTQGPGT